MRRPERTAGSSDVRRGRTPRPGDGAGAPVLAAGDRASDVPGLLRGQLRARVAAWERAALLEVVLALALNAPWIYLLHVLDGDIVVFDP